MDEVEPKGANTSREAYYYTASMEESNCDM